MTKTRQTYKIRIFPAYRDNAPDIFLNAEDLIFLRKPDAYQYALECLEIEYFWAHHIKEITVIEEL